MTLSTRAGMAVVLGMLLAPGFAWAEARVLVTREESKPSTVEIQAGDEVEWLNASGGSAHMSFGNDAAIQFSVGHGDSRVKFTTPGAYRYTVHISGTKAHAHTGTVIVK